MAAQGRAGAYTALVLVQLFFATMAVAGKLALRDLPALSLAAVRVVAGALALLAVARLLHGPLRPRPGDLRRYALLGVFGVFGNQVLFILGLRWITAVDAVLLIATIPAFTYLFSALRGEQRVDGVHLAGLALAFGGVAVVVGHGVGGQTQLLGGVLVVLNAASYAWYLVLSRREVVDREPAVVVAWTFVAGSALVLAVAAPSLVAVEWGAVPPRAWRTVGFIVLFPTVGSYLLNLVALRRLPSRTVAAFIYLQPVFGAALAVAVLGESIRPLTALGAAMVLAGIGLVMHERQSYVL